ncbi:MAG: response regulator transcription factor [Clostridia bacterium]|nr:response regulator transcription factor [Clostridia bacterium]
MRILVVEDERDLNEIIGKQLIADGYSVDNCFDGEEAIDILDYTDYDGVVLDIMLPKADGYQVLRSIRDKGKSTPVLFLTAKDSVEDRVLGLDSGANDYLVKPFSLKELSARVRAMIRHFYGNTSNEIVIGDLHLNRESHQVKRGETYINLSAKEFALLEYLMLNKGKVLSRDNIENHIWNFDYEGGTNVVDVYIRYLRKKIDDGFSKKMIETVRGRGYVIRDGE